MRPEQFRAADRGEHLPAARYALHNHTSPDRLNVE